MTVKVTEEWRAVAVSGRIVESFTDRERAKQWRETHQQHPVSMVRVTTTVEETEDELC